MPDSKLLRLFNLFFWFFDILSFDFNWKLSNSNLFFLINTGIFLLYRFLNTLLIFKTQSEHLGVLKSFLIFLNMIRDDELKNIDQDDHVFDVLRKI